MRRAPAAPALRAVLDAEHGPKVTRSAFERTLLALIRSARLPEPECNVWLQRRRVDFLCRAQRLVVETDGWRFHRSRARFEADHSGPLDLGLAGFRVERVTWRQLEQESHAVIALLATYLAV